MFCNSIKYTPVRTILNESIHLNTSGSNLNMTIYGAYNNRAKVIFRSLAKCEEIHNVSKQQMTEHENMLIKRPFYSTERMENRKFQQ